LSWLCYFTDITILSKQQKKICLLQSWCAQEEYRQCSF